MVTMTTGMLFISCSESMPYSEDVYQNLWIYASPSYIDIDENNDGGWINVNCQDEWYVTNKPTWINVTSSSGNGGYDIYYYADDNNESTNRSGNMTIATGSIIQKEIVLSISQQPTHAFDASMETTNYSAFGDYWFMRISSSSSRSWTITKNDSWVHLNTSTNSSYSYTGKGDSSVRIYVDANPNTTARYSSLKVTSGNKSKTITISQDAAAPTLTVSESDITLPYKGSTNRGSFKISSNTSWKITTSYDGYWLNVSPTSGSGDRTVNLSAGVGPSSGYRYATLTIETTSGNKITRTISVKQ